MVDEGEPDIILNNDKKILSIDQNDIDNNNNNNNNNNQQLNLLNYYKKSNHPTISIMTSCLKLFPLITYIIFGIFMSNDGLLILFTLLLASCDFWFTKNIAGRILVGLRWWVEIKNNEEIWRYESSNEIKEGADKGIFWSCIYLNSIIWGIFFIFDLITFKFVWGGLTLIMFCLANVNTYEFFKCSKSQQKNLMELTKKYFIKKNNNNNTNDLNNNNINN
jgi:hypothetical protein